MSDFFVPIVQSQPTRIVPSGSVTVTAGTSVKYIGQNSRQDRVAAIITNVDASLSLKVQTVAGVNFATVFPQRSFLLSSCDDFLVQNPNGADVIVQVCELYPDTGKMGRTLQSVAAAGQAILKWFKGWYSKA